MKNASLITTHVLDTNLGKPARGVKVVLEFAKTDGWQQIATGVTDNDGRVTNLLDVNYGLASGTYRLNFEIDAYYFEQGKECFYSAVQINFKVRDPREHFHVPLLISGFGYSTYRGS